MRDTRPHPWCIAWARWLAAIALAFGMLAATPIVSMANTETTQNQTSDGNHASDGTSNSTTGQPNSQDTSGGDHHGHSGDDGGSGTPSTPEAPYAALFPIVIAGAVLVAYRKRKIRKPE